LVMKLDYIRQQRRLIRPVLLGLSVVTVVLTLAKVRSFFAAATKAQTIVAQAVARGESDPGLLHDSLAGSEHIAEDIKRENLFVPPTPRRHPVSAVLGILGSEALIDGRWYKVGDHIADAEIVAIEPTSVTIKWDGREKVFAPLSAVTATASTTAATLRSVRAQRTEHSRKKKTVSDKPKKITGPRHAPAPKASIGSSKAKLRTAPKDSFPAKLATKLKQQRNKALNKAKQKVKAMRTSKSSIRR